jgi:hypothetical protein
MYIWVEKDDEERINKLEEQTRKAKEKYNERHNSNNNSNRDTILGLSGCVRV